MRGYNVVNFPNKGEYEIINIPEQEKLSKDIHFKCEKDKTKFINSCELLIRGSEEYRDWIDYLKKYKDMDKCAVFQNLNSTEMKKIKLEIHHGPFSLYDIVTIVVNKYIKEDIPIDYFDISEEVMRLHYENKVGLIPLSKTIHKLVHDGKVFIPLQAYYGPAMIGFIKEYEEYLGEYEDILREIIEASAQIAREGTQDLSILDKRYVYLNVDGVELPHIIE